MKVIDILNSSPRPFPSLEIVPPLKGMSKEELVETIRPFMEFCPKFMNITCHRDEVEYVRREDGSFMRRIVRNRISEVAVCGAVMSEFSLEMVPHIICGGASEFDIMNELDNLAFMGIHNILALRGDSLQGEKRFTPAPGGFNHAGELVAAVRRHEAEGGPNLCIGVGAYPEKHFEAPNLETDIENLKRKVEAGADYIITQMFFDNGLFYNFVKKCREAGITVPIIPGIKPLSTVRQVEMLPKTFALDIPLELTEAVAHAGGKDEVYEIGRDWAIAQCRDLLAHGVPAIHFYTMGKTGNVLDILKSCF